MTGRSAQPPGRAGKVRAARLTDLAALGELSRLAQAADSGARSLGLPVAGPPIGVFIRAPIVERIGPDVDVLARLDDGRIVAVRERNVLATAFHPELAGETRLHRLLATMASEHDDPGEGAGRRPHPLRRARIDA